MPSSLSLVRASIAEFYKGHRGGHAFNPSRVYRRHRAAFADTTRERLLVRYRNDPSNTRLLYRCVGLTELAADDERLRSGSSMAIDRIANTAGFASYADMILALVGATRETFIKTCHAYLNATEQSYYNLLREFGMPKTPVALIAAISAATALRVEIPSALGRDALAYGSTTLTLEVGDEVLVPFFAPFSPSDARLVVRPHANLLETTGVFHEWGHALAFLAARHAPMEFQRFGSTAWTEAIAFWHQWRALRNIPRRSRHAVLLYQLYVMRRAAIRSLVLLEEASGPVLIQNCLRITVSQRSLGGFLDDQHTCIELLAAELLRMHLHRFDKDTDAYQYSRVQQFARHGSASVPNLMRKLPAPIRSLEKWYDTEIAR